MSRRHLARRRSVPLRVPRNSVVVCACATPRDSAWFAHTRQVIVDTSGHEDFLLLMCAHDHPLAQQATIRLDDDVTIGVHDRATMAARIGAAS